MRKTKVKSPNTPLCGFTLIELLVVVAIIALLLAVIMPALGKAKEAALKIICRNNIRQQSIGITLYSNDNDSYVPSNNFGGWLWDMTFLATTQLSQYAGFDDNDTFFCPANRIKKATDARFWQYRYLETLGGTYPNPVPLYDETVPPISTNLSGYYRVLPYVYMFDKRVWNTTTNQWVSLLPATLLTGEDANWILKLSEVKSTGSKIMVMDAVISNSSGTKFKELTEGGIDGLSAGNLTDNTNHLARQIIGTGVNQGPKPSGANIAYADGHADWRSAGDYNSATGQFTIIKHRVNTGDPTNPMWFWW